MHNCQFGISAPRSVTLTLVSTRFAAAILESIFGYTLIEQNNNCCKFISGRGINPEIVNLVESRNNSINYLPGTGNYANVFYLRNKIFGLSIQVTQLGEVFFEYAPNDQPSFVTYKTKTGLKNWCDRQINKQEFPKTNNPQRLMRLYRNCGDLF